MMTSDDSLDCLPHQQAIQRFEGEVLSLSSCFMTSDGLLSAFDDLLIASFFRCFPSRALSGPPLPLPPTTAPCRQG